MDKQMTTLLGYGLIFAGILAFVLTAYVRNRRWARALEREAQEERTASR